MVPAYPITDPAPPAEAPAAVALPPAAAATYLPAIIGIVAQHFERNARDLTGATTLKDLNADSLHRVELVCAAEEAFGITIPDADAYALGGASTLLDLAAVVAKAKRGTVMAAGIHPVPASEAATEASRMALTAMRDAGLGHQDAVEGALLAAATLYAATGRAAHQAQQLHRALDALLIACCDAAAAMAEEAARPQ